MNRVLPMRQGSNAGTKFGVVPLYPWGPPRPFPAPQGVPSGYFAMGPPDGPGAPKKGGLSEWSGRVSITIPT